MSYSKLIFNEFGNPTEVLHVEEKISNLPEPKEDELILQNLACPIHPSVIYTIRGHKQNPGEFPPIPGNDTVSKVYKKGSKVTKYDVGQHVLPLLLFDEGACQEYMVVKENQILMAIPDEIDDLDASQFVVNGLTVFILFEDIIALKEGDWAIQTTASSVIGKCAIHLAKVKGVKMINVVRKQEQIEQLKALGADHVIVYKEENIEALKKEVFDITRGKGVKYALDAVGGKMGTFAFEVLGKKGTHVSYGLLSGNHWRLILSYLSSIIPHL